MLRTPFVQTRRDAWVEVNLASIEYNIKQLKNLISEKTKFLAVVKADAYGHGATMIASTLQASGVDMFGVASIDEGLQLRESGITLPILVLGSAPSWGFVSAVENDIQLSIFTQEHINACKEAFSKLGKRAKVQIKIDTGMNRIGLKPDFASDFIDEVMNYKEIELMGVFTHLACAEDKNKTELQIKEWDKILSGHSNNLTKHIANTAGLISYPSLHFDLVRAGIGIFGLWPDLPQPNNNVILKPVMSLKGRIAHIHEVLPEEGVSYGHTFIANKKAKVATIPVGYADGVSRNLSNKIYGLINGQKVKQIGNITMDQMMFDISNVDKVQAGDIITLIGEDNGKNILIDEWAKILGTIHYELTCRLKARLPRVYTRY